MGVCDLFNILIPAIRIHLFLRDCSERPIGFSQDNHDVPETAATVVAESIYNYGDGGQKCHDCKERSCCRQAHCQSIALASLRTEHREVMFKDKMVESRIEDAVNRPGSHWVYVLAFRATQT